jgi:hypothetical protein
MRSRIFIGVGLLAIVGGAAVAQSPAVMKMELLPMRPIIWMPMPPPPPQAPDIKFRGCAYYEHVNWGGKWHAIPGGVHRKFVGDSWNETISSFSCNPACRIAAFQDRDFKGPRVEFGTTQSVSDWNDRISSMIAVCKRPW